jgi:hypothetical protein
MAKIRKLSSARIKKISGGKEPPKLVEEFMIRRGFDPDSCLQQKTVEIATWSVPLSDEEELEITLEGLNRPAETTLYMGVNILTVPVRELYKTLIAVLTIADTLIGAKLSLVNYDIVLSVTQYTSNLGVDDIDYYFELLSRQKVIMQDAIIDEINH